MKLPLAEGLDNIVDLPHTITSAIMYRMKIMSFGELPEDKQPPRGIWDKPHRLSEYMRKVWDTKKGDSGTDYYEYSLEDVE